MAEAPGRANDEAQYARAGAAAASAESQSARRAVLVGGGLLVAALVAGFVALGLWQWNKFALKTRLQAELDAKSRGALVALPAQPASAESLHYRHVQITGEFDAARQILVDNRVHRERAGYHVITPLKLDGGDTRVLVNRGWVPAPAEHGVLPDVPAPAGRVALTGIAVVPPSKFFTLAPAGQAWEPVWQNLDLARFASSVPHAVQPVLVQLDPEAPHGYVRDWPRPDERAEKHLSYALQWFGFAASSVGIWFYLLLRRP